MPKPAATTRPSPFARLTGPAWVCFAAILFVAAMVCLRWNEVTGFTSLIQFSDDWAPTRIPALNGVRLAQVPSGGYDGQFYAQVAVSPDLTSPTLWHALDNPPYRERRIILPLVAHLLGAGDPFNVLQVYALLNFFAWMMLARIWWKEVDATSKYGAAIWLTCMLSLGALDNVRLSLTDLTSTLFLVLATQAVVKNKKWIAASWLITGGFVRETTILAVSLIWPTTSKSGISSQGVEGRFGEKSLSSIKSFLLPALVVMPVVCWLGWLWLYVPGGGIGDLDFPGIALARHISHCISKIKGGHFDTRFIFGLIGALGLMYQSIFVLRLWNAQRRGGNTAPALTSSAIAAGSTKQQGESLCPFVPQPLLPWLSLGVPFAMLFWILGPGVFDGYWAAARACLPLTFAFNRLLPRDRYFWPRLVAGNFFMLHGIWRMLP